MGIAHESMSRGAPAVPERPTGLPDRYRVRRHIANGGMASVWCAEDVLLRRSVAVKILAERFAHDQVAVARFKREARAAARVSNHTHVVTVYDVGDLAPDPGSHLGPTEGRAFLVMEYLAGGTVADAIHHDSVRRHEAMRWLREAASALDHAHDRGIVHRDIKPANFLLDRARVLHVADFGIARLTTEETITSSDQLFGTAAYLSPEQALGREATGASDRYALAVAAFELLAGQRPFSAPHFSAQARQHIEEPPPAASELDRTLPPAVDEVLFAGLAKDPAARPESAGAFVAALQDALAGGSGTLAREPRHRGAIPADDGPRAPARRPDPAAPGASTAAARRRAPATRPPAGRMPGPPPRERARRRRLVALGSIAAAVLVIAGIALAAMRSGGGHGSGSAVALRNAPAVTRHTATHASAPRPTTRAHRHTTTTVATTSSTTPTTPVVTTFEQLQSTGHQEMLAGDFDSAIPTLKQAVADSPADSPTHAYALYDLGRSLVLSGDPQSAIPVLEQRLKIPNQQATVRVMLKQALAAAGQAPAPSGGAAPTTPDPTTSAPPPGLSGTPAPTGPPAPGGSGGAGLTGGAQGGDDRGSDGGEGDGPGEQENGRLRGGHRGAHRHHSGGGLLHFITAAAG